ncbi:hypothetical protein GIS00_22620 [Nakamurella sp. YIM 132087]|uniref:Uncharacterized protein n=1 Tax=Nakamurella alba TaxID=2665158 RepID=A0A7K1FRH0_9ACTN|nr:hypothetical protein [Nakamurella alba]MTD16735.1 hypothetical protein [Nakamurella alba]
MDVEFVGGDGRTYTDTNNFYWSNNIYAVGGLYKGASATFATIVEVPAGAIAGGKWRADDTSVYGSYTTAWWALS